MENLTHHKKHYFNSLGFVVWNTCGYFFGGVPLLPTNSPMVWKLSYSWALSLTIGAFQKVSAVVEGVPYGLLIPVGNNGGEKKTDTQPNIDINLWKWSHVMWRAGNKNVSVTLYIISITVHGCRLNIKGWWLYLCTRKQRHKQFKFTLKEDSNQGKNN